MNIQYDTNLNSYKEAKALQQLLRAIDDAERLDNEKFASGDENIPLDQFTITIAGIQTAFIVGGPQTDALREFVAYIASDNGYAVDFDKSTVED